MAYQAKSYDVTVLTILVPSSCCFPQTASRRTTMHESRLAYERVLLASDRREQRDTGAKKPYLLSKKTQYYFKMDLNQREQRDTGATEPYLLSKETNILSNQPDIKESNVILVPIRNLREMHQFLGREQKFDCEQFQWVLVYRVSDYSLYAYIQHEMA